MNDDLETLLRRMPLKAPPAALDGRVLAARPRRRVRVWVLATAGAALAAAAAVIIALGLPQGGSTDQPTPATPPGALVDGSRLNATAPSPTATPQATPLQPVRLEHNWTTVSYEGVVAPAEEPPLQKFRRRTVEHVQWFDPARGIRMETTVPHEDVILIKADMQ